MEYSCASVVIQQLLIANAMLRSQLLDAVKVCNFPPWDTFDVPVVQ